MAKFKDLHLILQQDQRIYLGDDADPNPTTYPSTSTADRAMIAFTTISGYNETSRGGSVTSITPVDELVVTVPVAGERATTDYHLVRYDQLVEFIASSDQGDWQESVLSFATAPPGSPSNGDRYIVQATASGSWTGLEDYIEEWNTASGTWVSTAPNEGMTTFVETLDKFYLYYNGSWAPMGEGIDHGDLTGLGDDDHPQYILVDGSRGFTGTVSGIDPTQDYHLATKGYVDGEISTLSSSIITDHGGLSGLGDDDHTQYILVDGSRGFTGTVSGVDPTQSYHLTTKFYVDGEIDTLSGTLSSQIITDHGGLSGLADDDHPQYILVDGSRGFTSTVSGVTPVQDYDLATKGYVDGEITTLSGYLDSQIITDHGALTGLGDDDHTQYILTDGSRGFTGTVSGIDPVASYDLTTKNYVDQQFSTLSGTRKWGRMSVINGAISQAVTFDNSFADDSYTLVATLTNEVDSPPSIYSTIQGVKTAGGFTTYFSGEIDSDNFILEWIANYAEQS